MQPGMCSAFWDVLLNGCGEARKIMYLINIIVSLYVGSIMIKNTKSIVASQQVVYDVDAICFTESVQGGEHPMLRLH